MPEWKEDKIEECHYITIDSFTLTLRIVGNQYLSILTKPDWHQAREFFKTESLNVVKAKSLDWAVEYIALDERLKAVK